MLARLIEPQIWHQLGGSVTLCGGGFRRGMMASALLDAIETNTERLPKQGDNEA